MRTLYFECNMGAAGDMITAALLELVPDREEALERLNGMGIPGVRFTPQPSAKCGILGTHLHVEVNGEEEVVCDVTSENHAEAYPYDQTHGHGHQEHDHHGHDHDHHHHEHGHAHHDQEHGHHEHGHTHHGMAEIRELIAGLTLSDEAKEHALAVYRLIAEAESSAHGAPIEQVHFHEVGAMDAVADVCAAACLLEMIGAERIIASPMNTGKGQVKCVHGIIPVPAPATAHILEGVPTYSNWVEGELCTPTGAAILRHYADSWGDRPRMIVRSVGYGMGHKDFPAANCIRAFLGDGEEGGDQVTELSCNVDDMTGEEIGFAIETLLAKGAREVFVTPVIMKKSRPGQVITVIVSPDQKEAMVREIFRHTSTIGIRETAHPRYVLQRSIRETETAFGTLREKVSEGYGVRRVKAEHDDLARIAREQERSIREVKEAARKRR